MIDIYKGIPATVVPEHTSHQLLVVANLAHILVLIVTSTIQHAFLALKILIESLNLPLVLAYKDSMIMGTPPAFDAVILA